MDEFRTLLVRSYSTAYSAYKFIVIEVKPLQAAARRRRRAGADTLIKLPGGAPPVNVDYSMFKGAAGWKVYDVTVDGVSLVTTYRSTFSDQIQKGGIDGLIKTLADMNAAKTCPSRPGSRSSDRPRR